MSMWGGDCFTTSAGVRRMGLSRPRNGRTYIMYHGTSWWAAQKIMAKGFCPSNRGMLGQGVYLSRDLEKASRYPLDLTEHQKVVIKVKVNVGKVKKIDCKGHPLQKTWHDEGYDSAWVPPDCGMVKSGLEENCVWDPNRITVLDIIKSKTEPTLQSEDTDEEEEEDEDEEDTEEGDTEEDYEEEEGEEEEDYEEEGVQEEEEEEEENEDYEEEEEAYGDTEEKEEEEEEDYEEEGVQDEEEEEENEDYEEGEEADGDTEEDDEEEEGVYLSRDLEKASRYPLDLTEHLKVVRVTFHDNGYDSAWIPSNSGMVKDSLEETCVWDPNRITVLDIILWSGREFLKIGENMSMWGGDCFTTSAGARRMGLSGPRNGRTYIMYHGTSWWDAQKIMAKGFCPSNRGMLGQGVYLSRDLEKASRYPLDLTEHQKVVIKVKVNVGKVKKIDRQGHPLQKTWHDEGYDSAWVPPDCGMVKSGLEENCVWDPNRITVLDIIKSKTEPTLQSEDTDEEEEEEEDEEDTEE
ncbi:uncharacterized protein LOC115147859, partial [Salmo trutta]|uniref:uncharacterized protein LOC115147859 n=1 Tax=Salmo trutta TaxID=8032 RepID=UPI00113255F9